MKELNINFQIIDDNAYYCAIKYEGKQFIGSAFCHEDDYDFKSEKTGFHIAELRANIELCKYLRDESLNKYKIFKGIYHNLKQNENVDLLGIEMKYIIRQMNAAYTDLMEARAEIKTLRKDLNYYIVTKDKLYKKLRREKSKVTNEQWDELCKKYNKELSFMPFFTYEDAEHYISTFVFAPNL